MTPAEFSARLTQRDLPTNPMARIKALARELAEGAAYRVWDTSFYTTVEDVYEIPSDERIQRYIRARWMSYAEYPSLELLVQNGYLVVGEADRFSRRMTIARPAFELLQETEPTTIFISYKRSESSAVALLVHDRLQAAGLAPFLDLQLQPGENWPERLRQSVVSADVLILLLSHETLHSKVTKQEVLWAIEAGITVLPMWHSGFSFSASDWPELPEAISSLLKNTHTIRVTEEQPLAYNTALVELLNYFGISA